MDSVLKICLGAEVPSFLERFCLNAVFILAGGSCLDSLPPSAATLNSRLRHSDDVRGDVVAGDVVAGCRRGSHCVRDTGKGADGPWSHDRLFSQGGSFFVERGFVCIVVRVRALAYTHNSHVPV